MLFFKIQHSLCPDFIFAADPADKTTADAAASKTDDEPSQRPFQTISALAAKLNLSAPNLDTSHTKKHFAKMVTHALAASGTVLISWQHQDILPAKSGADCIVTELLSQTSTEGLQNVPTGPWPGTRYDIVLVFDRPSGTGVFETCTQVPQMLLVGDSESLFPVND